MIKKLTYFLLGCLGFASCAIENDIPYPLRVASISSIEVEGQRAAEGATDATAVIDKAAGTVTLYVNDSVDITRLKITRLVLDPREATIGIDSAVCDNYGKFPTNDFASLDSLPLSANTRVDFSEPVTMTLSTYQDYPWKVTVNQIIQRDVDVYGMVNHVLDVNSRNVIIYVNPKEVPDLSNVQIKKLNLGGEYGKVTPDPTTVHDFTKSQTFYAARHGEDTWQEWKVFVYQTEEGGSTGSSDVFAMVTRATVKGSVQSGKTPTVEYRKQGSSDWNTVPAANVTTSGTSFTATLTGLSGSTTYNYRVTIDGVAGSEQSFTTVAPVALENGSMENWSQDGKIWYPNAAGANPFWGTGNPGAANFIGNLTTATDESVKGKAALLETKDAIIKLGAGNIFTGDFELEGLNGLLHFGRSFSSFPTSLRLYYKYTPATIDMIGDNVGDLASLKGQTDMCQIYIALSDKIYEIHNDPKNRQLFDPNDSGIIAYGEFTSSQSVTSYKQLEIPLEYRATNRTPKYIIIVASSSKYGDYYIGGVGSKLWLDEMELVYE
ncbi:MAG TPA: PCMD domain-containing protein [Candidatus Parabacteroides intestinipullorum]|uniref:PCMD domain-containing protein n=1 Tax=Candidatus Parabacteroides intestinipullorum TaxID=2838723 RepID=A0A9D1X9I3_9BACT|nr:PCMD domain-containing protein [Candidatus Parabacteroides intestinipullorum]